MSDTKFNPMKQHGTFSWNELMTKDVDRSKAFYSELFNWQYEDLEMDEPYTIASVYDQEVAGMMPKPPGTDDIPSMWGAYVTVDDVDKSAQQAVSLGGQIFMEPRDIPDFGRIAMIADPQNTIISIITYLDKG